MNDTQDAILLDITQLQWSAPWYQSLAVPTAWQTRPAMICDTATLLNNAVNIQWQRQADNAIHNINTVSSPLTAVKFVPQTALPVGEAYEHFIAQTAQIPTRNNFHDLLNGLIWLNFPRSKVAMNAKHEAEIAQYGLGNTRTATRNALTLLDENGGIVVSCEQSVLKALQAFDWQGALWHQRQSWLQGDTKFFPTGHALLEKLMMPRKAITSHVLLCYVDKNWFRQTVEQQRHALDGWLSQLIANTSLYPKMLQPLPIFGIPNFCQRQTPDFYADTAVFRQRGTRPLVKIWAMS